MSSFDLYPEETAARTDALQPVTEAPADTFDNFLPGAGNFAMQGFAKTARAVDMLGSVGPIVQDTFTGGTEAQDKYFKEHDDIFNRAVDYWTPKANEVGIAGEVVGQLLGLLPQVFMSPGLAVGATQLSTAEDLTKQGVDGTKAQLSGAVQAAGLGLGIWMPILGKTLSQRVLVGGAGFNAVQGIATRAATGAILEGTPAEGNYPAFDAQSITLDVLLGAAFGGLAHVNPAMRAQGEEIHNRFDAWAKGLKPSDVDALAVLKQAEHLNVDSMPGKPADLSDINAHVDRIRQAINDLANDRPVNVEAMPEPRFTVYHGSPHEFQQFDISKIGTGEGAQAYGHGLYFAGNKDVAEFYRKALTKGNLVIDGESFVPGNYEINTIVAMHTGTDAELSKKLHDYAETNKSNPYLASSDAEYVANAIDRGALKKQGQGRVYHAEIEKEDNYLLWDKPLSEQSAKVKAALENIAPGLFTNMQRYKELSAETTAMMNSGQIDTPAWDAAVGETRAIRAAVGMDLSGYGEEFYKQLSEKIGGDEAASKKIHEAGIRGIKYLDGSSRSQGDGNYNYVIFSDADVKIIPDPAVAKAKQTAAEASQTGLDPLASEAARFAAENPDLPITIGKNLDGTDITTTPRQMLEDADAMVKATEADAKLFDVAAGCIMGAI